MFAHPERIERIGGRLEFEGAAYAVHKIVPPHGYVSLGDIIIKEN